MVLQILGPEVQAPKWSCSGDGEQLARGARPHMAPARLVTRHCQEEFMRVHPPLPMPWVEAEVSTVCYGEEELEKQWVLL